MKFVDDDDDDDDDDRDPMTFMYERDPYSLEMYRMSKIELRRIRPGFRKLSSDRQTDGQTRPKLYTTPLRGWPTVLNRHKWH